MRPILRDANALDVKADLHLDHVYDVRDYGVTGDHSSADYARLGAMESTAYASGGVIYFPPGSYSFDGWVGWRSGYQIEMAPGAVFDISNDTGDWMSFADGPSQLRNVGRFQQIFDINEPNDVVFSKPGEIWVGWWLGKVGDGVTDDGLALQGAIGSAAEGSTIHPYGRHKTSKQIAVWKSGITIDGVDPNLTWIEATGNHYMPDNNEVMLRCPTKYTSWAHQDRSFIWFDSPSDTAEIYGCALRNITIEPPVNNQTDLIPGPGQYSDYCQMKSIYVGCVIGFELSNVTLHGQAWEGFYHMWIYNTDYNHPIRHRVEGCTFLPPMVADSNAIGVLVNWNRSSATRDDPDYAYLDIKVTNCTFDGCAMGILQNGTGYVFSNNVFRRIPQYGIQVGENDEGSGDGVISNNAFKQTGYGTMALSYFPSAINGVDAESGCTIIGNTISDTIRGSAFKIQGQGFNLIGNTVSGQKGGQAYYAFYFSAAGNLPNYTTYMSGNVVQDSNVPGYHKWYGGLNWQAQAGAVGSHVYLSGDVLDCNVTAISAGTDPNYATIHLSGVRLHGVIYPGTYDYAWKQTMNDANQWDDIPLFATFGGTNKPILLETGYISGMQQENIAADNNTVIPLTDYLNIVASNAEHVGEDPNLTISESGAKDGQRLTITTWPSSDDYVIKRIAGQVETTGDANITMSWTGLKSVQFIYMYDRWVQVGN
jgi:hypothetical protein